MMVSRASLSLRQQMQVEETLRRNRAYLFRRFLHGAVLWYLDIREDEAILSSQGGFFTVRMPVRALREPFGLKRRGF